MNIELTTEQFATLKEIVTEYREICYQGIIDYQKYALDVEDPAVRQQYVKMAEDEEARFNKTKALVEYLEDIPT